MHDLTIRKETRTTSDGRSYTVRVIGWGGHEALANDVTEVVFWSDAWEELPKLVEAGVLRLRTVTGNAHADYVIQVQPLRKIRHQLVRSYGTTFVCGCGAEISVGGHDNRVRAFRAHAEAARAGN